jgi:hypothetical protein
MRPPVRTVETGQFRPPANHGAVDRDMLRGDGTYATTLLVWAIDRLGTDEHSGQPGVLVWAPETIVEEIADDYGVRLSKRNLDKLMAAVTVVTTDLFFKNVGAFVQLANVLAGDDFQPDEFDPADSVECAWAITEALLLWPPDDGEEPFADDVRHYVGAVLREEGYVTPPDVLRIALDADFSAKVRYDYADDPDTFSMIYKGQQAKADDVTDVIRDGLGELLRQLQALRLREGSTAEIQERIALTLRQGAKGG